MPSGENMSDPEEPRENHTSEFRGDIRHTKPIRKGVIKVFMACLAVMALIAMVLVVLYRQI
jgi:hypothetical protein